MTGFRTNGLFATFFLCLALVAARPAVQPWSRAT